MATAELESIAHDHTHDSAIFLIADHEGGGCVVIFEAVDELSGNRAVGVQLVDQLGLVPCHRNRSMQPFKLQIREFFGEMKRRNWAWLGIGFRV